MKLIQFGSYIPPTPTKYDVELSDIDSASTGRVETGLMNRERVRADVYKVSLAFTNLTSDDVLNIKNSIKEEKFDVGLFDGEWIEGLKMYAGNRKITLKSVDDMSNCFWDMSFNLTEM